MAIVGFALATALSLAFGAVRGEARSAAPPPRQPGTSAPGAERGVQAPAQRAGQPPAEAVQPRAVTAATVTTPAEGQTVSLPFEVVVEAPPNVKARRYALEVAYLDPARKVWVTPGLLGRELDGAATVNRQVVEAELARFSKQATQWRLRARLVDPPGAWGPWRTFALAAAPAGREAPAVAREAAPTREAQNFVASPAALTIKLQAWNGVAFKGLGKPAYGDGPVNVEWDRKDLLWWFEYRVQSPGTTRAPSKLRWELSKAPFPAADWKPVAGWGLTGAVAVAAPPSQFKVDLSPLAPRPPGWGPQTAPKPGSGGVEAQVPKGTSKAPPPAGKSPPAGGGGAVAREAVVAGAVPSGPALLSLYVRVVPVDAAGTPAGPPSNVVELRFGPKLEQAPLEFAVAWPRVSFSSYRPVRPYDFDWQCWVVASQAVDLGMLKIAKGQANNVCKPENKDVLDHVEDAFSSFVDLVKSFVNWVSSTYSSLKSTLISKIASAIPGCDAKCRGALEMGLDIGLAAVGMPPSLPDFDQLQAMGEGYLVDVIAQQAAQTGVPFAEDAAAAALKEMIAQGKEAASSGGGGSGLWIPDTSRQYKPLLLTVEVSNSDSKPTTAITLEVADTSSDRYQPAKVSVPSLAPSKSYKIAVALKPTSAEDAWMALLPTAADLTKGPAEGLKKFEEKRTQARAALDAWTAKYQSGEVRLQAALRPQFGASTGHKIAFTASCEAKTSACVVK